MENRIPMELQIAADREKLCRWLSAPVIYR